MKFDVVTLFPKLFHEYLNVLPFKRAIEKRLTDITLWDLKNYPLTNYGSTDDKPYGGGRGMILAIEPIFKALTDIYKTDNVSVWHKDPTKQKIILLSPRGRKFNQKTARDLSQIDQATIICGRYEGVDARVEEYLATDVISVGDFVLSGGESAAVILMETVLRLIPGVLDEETTSQESFENDAKVVEYPQYTRPDEFRGMKVPEVLLSGNHKKIEKFRKNTADKVKKPNGPTEYLE